MNFFRKQNGFTLTELLVIFIGACIIGSLALTIAWYGSIVYVAHHFIAKYW